MTFDEKLEAVVEKARAMEDSGLKYDTIRDHIFASGKGIAWQLFKTAEERTDFCESDEYTEIQAILRRAVQNQIDSKERTR